MELATLLGGLGTMALLAIGRGVGVGGGGGVVWLLVIVYCYVNFDGIPDQVKKILISFIRA